MMMFRKVKAGIEQILVNAAQGRYKVVGYQQQTKNAAEFVGKDRRVTVYWNSFQNDKRTSAFVGPVNFDNIYKVELSASAPSRVDLTVLNNPVATAKQRSLALDSLQDGTKVADDSLDELFEIVTQVLMDAKNKFMGQEKGEVSNRWLERGQKHDVVPVGEYVTVVGNLDLSARTAEQIVGEVGTPGGIYDTTIQTDNVPEGEQLTQKQVDNT